MVLAARGDGGLRIPVVLCQSAPMNQRYEYKVVELREGMIGGKMSGDKLERVLNDHAKQGWQLKAITSVEVKGRIGPGGVEGVLVTLERVLS